MGFIFKVQVCSMWLIEGLTMWILDIDWWRCLFLWTIHAKNTSQSTALPNHGGLNIGYSDFLFRINCQRTDLLEQWNLPWTINVCNYVRKQVRQFERTVISFQNTRKVQIHPQPCSRFDTETCAYWLYSKSDANNRIHCQHMLSSIHYCYGKVTIVMLIVLRKWIIKQTPSSPTIWKLITLPIDVTLARVSSSTSWCTADQ